MEKIFVWKQVVIRDFIGLSNIMVPWGEEREFRWSQGSLGYETKRWGGGVGDFEQVGKQPNPQIKQFSKKYL